MATNRVIKILDAKNEKSDLKAVVQENCTHMSVPEQKKLLELLPEFEELFDGPLGDWNTEHVSFQLKECAIPYHAIAFPILKANSYTMKKEVNRLCKLVVLKWQLETEWALPSFIIPKKIKQQQLLVILGKSTNG